MKIENGKIYKIKGDSKYFKGKYGTANPEFKVEDESRKIWPNGGWGNQQGNPACMLFGMRSGVEGLPYVGNVYYGKIGASGELVHESELEET